MRGCRCLPEPPEGTRLPIFDSYLARDIPFLGSLFVRVNPDKDAKGLSPHPGTERVSLRLRFDGLDIRVPLPWVDGAYAAPEDVCIDDVEYCGTHSLQFDLEYQHPFSWSSAGLRTQVGRRLAAPMKFAQRSKEKRERRELERKEKEAAKMPYFHQASLAVPLARGLTEEDLRLAREIADAFTYGGDVRDLRALPIRQAIKPRSDKDCVPVDWRAFWPKPFHLRSSENADLRLTIYVFYVPYLVEGHGVPGGYTPLHKAVLANDVVLVRYLLGQRVTARYMFLRTKDALEATPLDLAALLGRADLCRRLIRKSLEFKSDTHTHRFSVPIRETVVLPSSGRMMHFAIRSRDSATVHVLALYIRRVELCRTARSVEGGDEDAMVIQPIQMQPEERAALVDMGLLQQSRYKPRRDFVAESRENPAIGLFAMVPHFFVGRDEEAEEASALSPLDTPLSYEGEELTPLMLAASHPGMGKIVELLMQFGADATARNGQRDTALMIACRKGHADAAAAIVRTRPLFLRALSINVSWLYVESGMNLPDRYLPNAHNVRGERALDLACAATEANDGELVRLLLRGGAVPGLIRSDGSTALHIAARMGKAIHARVLIDWVLEQRENRLLDSRTLRADETASKEMQDALGVQSCRRVGPSSAFAQSQGLIIAREFRSMKIASQLARDGGFLELAAYLESVEREQPRPTRDVPEESAVA